MPATLLILAAACGLAAIASDWRVRRPAFYLLKPLTTTLLIAVAVLGAAAPGLNREGALILGLVCCLAGDIALLGRSNRAFITGLLAFLLGHVAFVAGFYYGVLRFDWHPAMALIAVWAVGAGHALLPHTGRLAPAVIAYGAVLAAMLLAAAQRYSFHPEAPQLALLAGAALFAASDTVLAIRKFRMPEALLQPVILSTYWLAVGLIAVSIPMTVAAQPPPANPDGDPVLADPALHELSGLVAATAHEGYWGHNDGDDPHLYRIGPGGESLGRVRVPGLRLIDWEDLAAFESGGRRFLLIADVGDNFAVRPTVLLHAVAEPGPDQREAVPTWRMSLRLPDGARDIEAVAVDPLAREILLVSKRDPEPVLYAVPLPNDDTDAVARRLNTITTLPPPTEADIARDPRYGRFVSWPTAMDIAADGHSLMLVTYKRPYLWRRGPAEPWAEALSRPPRALDAPHLAQTEAGALLPDGRYVIGSEQLPAVIAVRPLPGG